MRVGANDTGVPTSFANSIRMNAPAVCQLEREADSTSGGSGNEEAP